VLRQYGSLRLVRAIVGAVSIGFVMAATPGVTQQAPAAGRSAPKADAAKPDTESESNSGWHAGCRADVKRFCVGYRGGRAKRHCLEANLTQVSQMCRSALDLRRQQRAAAVASCRQDQLKLCADANAQSDKEGSTGAVLQCLRLKTAEVGPDCAKALAGLNSADPGAKSGIRKN